MSIEDLDVELIPLLYVLNFEIGMKTKYSCFGHEYQHRTYIMFADEVSFEEGLRFVEYLSEYYDFKTMMHKYFVRKVKGVIEKNWVIESNALFIKTEQDRLDLCNELLEICRMYNRNGGGNHE